MEGKTKRKIFNDPVYGFVEVPYGILFDLIEHPYFQRLRRIRQLGLTDIVYPGAIHTRFSHAIGALHLMTQAIEVLKNKGVSILPQEAEGVKIAILLHDIGHGPISHALEHKIVNVHHESLSHLFMEALNKEFDGQLNLAIRIFNNEYPKKFLYQLVSGQLDMDRMDYLNRDSFFTGVSEGVIGYHRIIKMLTVIDNQLVVEEKGIYSIEKFLIARRLMYWQAYLHKTVLAAEQMLIRTVDRARILVSKGKEIGGSARMLRFLGKKLEKSDFKTDNQLLADYAGLDDTDIWYSLKAWETSDDKILCFLAGSIVKRKLFKSELSSNPPSEKSLKSLKNRLIDEYPSLGNDIEDLIITGKETNSAYSTSKEEIQIALKSGIVMPMSETIDTGVKAKIITKYYLCYPKNKNYLSASKEPKERIKK